MRRDSSVVASCCFSFTAADGVVACREQSVMLHMLAVAMTACHVDAKFDRAPSNICAIWFLSILVQLVIISIIESLDLFFEMNF